MEDLNDNELGFITNSLCLETNSLFNDELNLHSISHDYIKNGEDLFLSNDENWLTSLENESNFNQSTLANVNQQTQNCSINHHNQSDHENVNHHHRSITSNIETNQNSALAKKKRKLELFDNSNTSFLNGLLNNDVENVVEISDLGINQRSKSSNYDNKASNKKFNQNSLKENLYLSSRNKSNRTNEKNFKNEIKKEYLFEERAQEDDDDLDSDQEIENDLDEDEEIDELLRFPVSSSILDDQCGSPAELNHNALNHLLHDSDSGSSHFDDGYLSSATSTNLNLTINGVSNNLLSLNENKRQLRANSNFITNNSGLNQNSINDQLYQVHNYSCIKQDKFLHSASTQLNNSQIITNDSNQLIYLKHDGLLNGNYTSASSNSSISGGSNSSSPTQSPTARKCSYTRNRSAKTNAINSSNNEECSSTITRTTNLRSSLNTNLKLSQPANVTGSGRGSRSKPITDLQLTDEERRLLNKEGYTDFPVGENPQLSKTQEKVLRKIRRKIRNKRSAQCSRQRKKEYLEDLEKKFSKSTSENQCLKNELIKLRRVNDNLIAKIKKLMRNNSLENTNDQQLCLNQDQMNNLGETIDEKFCGEHLVKTYLIDQNNQTHKTQNFFLLEKNNKNILELANNLTLKKNDDELKKKKKLEKKKNFDKTKKNFDDDLNILENFIANDQLNNIENNELNCSLVDDDESNLNLELDDAFTLMPSSADDMNLDEFLNINDIKDDGLLRYVHHYSNDFQNLDYHQQAPIKTSLFLLVLCFVLMLVPFLRPDGLDYSLTFLESQVGQQTNDLVVNNNQLMSIL